MRNRMWSAAAVIAIAIIASPTVRAADTRVAMGPSDDPLSFAPADVTVPVGGSVEWFNDTDLEHDVQAEDGSFGTPGSGLLGKGQKYEFRFSKAGTFKYFCTPHKSAGMVGTVTVAGSGPAPTTPAPTPTTAAPAGGATTTTARGATTTTTRPAAGAPAGPTTTTTAGLGVTSTTQAASTTPTSAPETGDVTSTTMAAGTDGHGGEESAAETNGSEGGSDKKTNPVAVGLAGILTAVLAAISLKLLTG